MNNCGLVAQIYLDENLSLKSYLIVEFVGKKKTATDAKNQSVSSTLSLYRRRRVILRIRHWKGLKPNLYALSKKKKAGFLRQ